MMEAIPSPKSNLDRPRSTVASFAERITATFHDQGDCIGKASRFSTTVNMINIAAGDGLLALPYAFAEGGWIYTSLLLLCTAVLSASTLMVLVRSCNHYDANSYQALARAAGGAKLEAFVSCWMILFQFGACAAYLIIIFDTLHPVLEQWLGPSSFLTRREFIVPFFGTCVIFPLCLLRSLNALAPASALAVFSVAFASFSIVFKSIETISSDGVATGCCQIQKYPAWDNCDDLMDHVSSCGCCREAEEPAVSAFGSGMDFVSPVGIIVFALMSHIQAPAVFAELKDPAAGCAGEDIAEYFSAASPRRSFIGNSFDGREQERSKQRREESFRSIICVATSVVAFFYAAVGICGYVQFGGDVQSNVLNSYGETDDTMIIIARLCICCLVSLSYPILQLVSRSMIHGLTNMAMPPELSGAPKMSSLDMPLWKHVTLTTVFVGLTMVLALQFDDLGAVLSLIGATAGVLAMFMVPGYLLMVPDGPFSVAEAGGEAFAKKSGRSRACSWAGATLISGGFAVMITALLATFKTF